MDVPVYDIILLNSNSYSTCEPEPVVEDFLLSLLARLEGTGLIVYFSERDAVPGSNIVEETFRVLDKSLCILCVITESSLSGQGEKAWQQTVFSRILHFPLRARKQSYVPLAFGVKPGLVISQWPFLAALEMLAVPQNFQQSDSWLRKLMSCVQPLIRKRTADTSRETTPPESRYNQQTSNSEASSFFVANKDLLLEHLELIPALDHLDSAHILSKEEVACVEKGRSHQSKIEQLLNVLEQKGLNGQSSFLRTLQSIQPSLYSSLQLPGSVTYGSVNSATAGGDGGKINEFFSNTLLYQLVSDLDSQVVLHLGSRLGFTNSELTCIHEADPENYLQQGFSLLSGWRQKIISTRQPLERAVEDLKRAFEAIRRLDLSDLVQSIMEDSRRTEPTGQGLSLPPLDASFVSGQQNRAIDTESVAGTGRGLTNGNHPNNADRERDPSIASYRQVPHPQESSNFTRSSPAPASAPVAAAATSSSTRRPENSQDETDARQYGKLLVSLDEDLVKYDILSLKLLVEDLIPFARLERIKRGLHLFSELEDKGKLGLNNYDLLAELLYHIQRIDLLRSLPGYSVDRVKSKIAESGPSFSAFRLLLLSLCEEITKSDLEAIKRFCLNKLPKHKVDAVDSPHSLFAALRQAGLVGDNKVDYLKELFELQERNDLVSMVLEYEENELGRTYVSPSNGALRSDRQRENPVNGSNLPERTERAGLEPHRGLVPGEARLGPEAANNQVPVQTARASDPSFVELPSYRMNRKPRGICLIINNVKFYKIKGDPGSKAMPSRTGSNVDRDNLINIFEKLDFILQIHNDLTAEDMQQVVVDVAFRMDHAAFDCLVCCVLTHGANGGLYGVDGKRIQIQELTGVFKGGICKSLLGKPKLFFIQACQGKDKQPSIPMDIEGDHPYTPEVRGQDQLEPETLPNEADFLLGYATVPGFVSYRSRTQGSWYITALVRALDTYASVYDLLSILVKVNEEVARVTANISGGSFKQVPAPLVTLRKRLFFGPLP